MSNTTGITEYQYLLPVQNYYSFFYNFLKDKHEIDRMTLTMNVELPDTFSAELKHLLESLLQAKNN
jgi:hypothetical protein